MSSPSTTGPSPGGPDPLHRLIVRTSAFGVAVVALVLATVGGAGPVVDLTPRLPWATGGALLGGLLLLTVLGDHVSVPLRHGDQVEQLSLFEAAVLLDAALLPAHWALAVAAATIALREVVHRRPLVKAAFNLAMLTTCSSALVLGVHAVAAPGSGLGPRGVAGLAVGTLSFAVVNLLQMARLLGVVAGATPRDVVREESRLSGVMALGNLALGGTALSVLLSAPLLLPVTVMPAAALLYAYRAAAQEAEERERSTRLLELSALLAGRHDPDALLDRYVELVRQVFGADLALAHLDDDDLPVQTVLAEPDAGAAQHATAEVRALLDRAGGTAVALTDPLPGGWSRALVAPLEAEGHHLGAVLLAVRDRARPLGPRELALLAPTASALAVALRSSAHLRRLSEERSKLRAVVDSSSDGILVLDGDGVVQLWSPALETLTGHTTGAATGRPLRDLLQALGADGTPCDPARPATLALTPEHPQATVEMTLLRDDAEARVVRCAHAGVFDAAGALERDVVIVHDVTRERQVERLKADFIATVSHELRTPVTPIKGYADLLRRKGERMTPEKRAECLDVIADRAGHLARLVEDLLLASRISATEGVATASVTMGRDDLAALVPRACADFGPDGARISVHVPDSPVVVACDRVRVVQVLTNLVGNALKYSPAGSPVDVRLAVVDGVATVEVHDRGRGIPADQVERVFEKFHRVEDPMLMTTGGTGLGLYIARQLATAMGGTLACRSTLGTGSVFSFALPLVTTAPTADDGATSSLLLAARAARRAAQEPGQQADEQVVPSGPEATRVPAPLAVPPPRPAPAAPDRHPQPLG